MIMAMMMTNNSNGQWPTRTMIRQLMIAESNRMAESNMMANNDTLNENDMMAENDKQHNGQQ